MTELSEQSGYAASYGRDIRGIFRALWAGTADAEFSLDLMNDTVRIGLTRAFVEGTAQCGIVPAEWSPEEKDALRDAIYNEQSRIWPTLMFIEENSKANGGKWAIIARRATWRAQRYEDIASLAKVMSCGDKKLEWVLGYGIKKHCDSCVKLAGKVKRASTWNRAGIRPRNPPNPMLICGGWGGCFFRPTDLHLSPGPLPRLP